jgi:cytochrome c biogenesis factor
MRADHDADLSPVTQAAHPAAVPGPAAPRPAESARSIDQALASGIGCTALLLPMVAVLGAVLCFAAGLLSTASGCAPDGSALCSASGPWFTFVLPLFVSPIVAAVTAVGALVVRRHRSTWLAVGYLTVFLSILIGLTSASTGAR